MQVLFDFVSILMQTRLYKQTLVIDNTSKFKKRNVKNCVLIGL